LSPNVNKSVHMYCAVQYSTCTVQCSAVTELVVDGYVTPESDEKCEDVKKLQKEAEIGRIPARRKEVYLPARSI